VKPNHASDLYQVAELEIAELTDAGAEADPDDRREAARIRTVHRFAKVVRDGDAGLWRVRNISDSGMMLLTDADVALGERVAIHLSDTIVIPATVAWRGAGACGVSFDAPVACTAVLRYLAEERHDPGYRPMRIGVSLRALACGEHGASEATLVNVSTEGARIRSQAGFQPGMQIKLVLGSGIERRGTVRWTQGGQVGLQLAQPFDAGTLESARALALPPPEAEGAEAK
jgi:hypothetical protein